jgi:hypothetical protein
MSRKVTPTEFKRMIDNHNRVARSYNAQVMISSVSNFAL